MPDGGLLWYYALLGVLGACFLGLSISNIVFLRLASRAPSVTEGPLVSVLIPARNEEDNIVCCLNSLLDQTYANYEIIVYDDMSTDRTYEILQEYQARHPRIKVVKGTELPDGWYGKPHAMQRLAEHAAGEYLLFTDADTVHGSASISWAVTNIQHHGVDLLSAYPLHRTGSHGEVLVLSNLYLNVVLYLPLWLIPRTRSPRLSFTIGQFILFKASTFRAIDGYSAIRHRITEDVYISRYVKSRGYRVAFLDAKNHVECRMYRGFKAAVEGIAKNIYDYCGKNVLSIVALNLFILGCLILPLIILLVQCLSRGGQVAHAALGPGLFLLAWSLFLYNRKFPWYAPLLYPLLLLILLGIGWKSVVDGTIGKGYRWKGRTLRFTRPEARPIIDFSPAFKMMSFVVYYFVLCFMLFFDHLIFGIRVKGRERLKVARAFLVSNHTLYLDPAIVCCVIAPRRAYFSALETTCRRRFLGLFIRLLGAFPLPESNSLPRIVKPVKRALGERRFVHFFPEGELHHKNQDIRGFKDGVFYLAFLMDVPVIPAPIVLKKRFFLGRALYSLPPRVVVPLGEPVYPREFRSNGVWNRISVAAMKEKVRAAMQRAIDEESLPRQSEPPSVSVPSSC